MKIPFRYKVGIKIKSKNTNFKLVDSSTGILLNQDLRIINKGETTTIYKNLWRGDFSLKFAGKELFFSTNTGDQVLLDENFFVTINRKIALKQTIRKPGKIKSRLILFLSKKGWDYTFKKSTTRLVVCDYLKQAMKRETGLDAVICPIGINTSVQEKWEDLKLKHPSVIIIQNHQIKDKSAALIGFKKVVGALPEVTFYISRGLPENRDNIYYKAVIDTLGQYSNVVFVDVNKNNKFNYLCSADIYVLASGLDCTPATILEAGLAGRAVLASRVGGVPEMIIDSQTGWAIDNDDIQEWIDKIRLLTRDKGLSLKMGQANKRHITNKYNISKIAKFIYKQL